MERDTRATYIVLGLLVLGICFVAAHLYLNRESYAPWVRLVFANTSSTRTPTNEEAQDLIEKFKNAAASISLEPIKALRYTKDQDELYRKADMFEFEQMRKHFDLVQTNFLTVEKAKETFSPLYYDYQTKPISFNGLVKKPNLDVIGFICVPSSKAAKPEHAVNITITQTSTGKPPKITKTTQKSKLSNPYRYHTENFTFPVGWTPKGELKIAAPIYLGSPTYKPEPAVKLPNNRQKVSPAKARAFARKVEATFNRGDWSNYLALHDRRGASQYIINKITEDFTRDQQLKHSRYGSNASIIKEVTFRSHDHSFGPKSDSVQMLTLPLVGFLEFHPKSPEMQVLLPGNLMVGIDENGELKIPLFKQQPLPDLSRY